MLFQQPLEKNSELEVTYNVTIARLNYIINSLSNKGIPFERNTFLDLNYSKSPTNTYRITLKHNAIPKNLLNSSPGDAFEALKGSHSVLLKKRIKTEQRVKLSTENTVSHLDGVVNKSRVIARYKDRYTQTVYNIKPFVIKIEATVVSTGKTLNLSNLVESTCGELEVELFVSEAVEGIPREVIDEFERTVETINALLEDPIVNETKLANGKLWKPDNKVSFLSWMYNTYKHYSEVPKTIPADDDFCTSKKTEKLALFPHQKMVRDYLEYESPYRGLLLYHGLGVGKTCASIAAAEGFIMHNKKIIVMVPASLLVNYKEEIIRCATINNPNTKMWSLIKNKEFASELKLELPKKGLWVPFISDAIPESDILQKNVKFEDLDLSSQKQATTTLNTIVDSRYEFIRYNGITSKALAKFPSNYFDDSFVIIDEAHNFISRTVNGSKIARDLYSRLMYSSNMKIILLSGTPIINHPFELAMTLNLVRGPMYTYTVPIDDNEKYVLSMLSEKNVLKYINNLVVDEVNHTASFSLFPKNYVQVYNKSSGSNSGSNGTVITREEWPEFVESMVIDAMGVRCEYSKKLTLAYPNDHKEFDNTFLDLSDPENPKIKNFDMFTRRALGLVSFFKSTDARYFPYVYPRKILNVNMSDYQFIEYTKKRDSERKMENNQKRSAAMSGVMGNKSSVYRAFSRMACNFVFPESMVRPFPKDLRKEARKEIDNLWDDETETEPKKEKGNATRIEQEYNEKLNKLMKALEKQASTLLSERSLTNLYSPKMQSVYEHIESTQGKVLLYSQFKSIEGIGVLKTILNSRGYIEVQISNTGAILKEQEVMKPEYDNKRYIIFDTNKEKSKILLQLFNNNSNNLRGEFIKMIMVTQSGAEGISLKNVRRVLILEPFWNMVRIDQVIGRAVRTCSHNTLPESERNVEILIFCSVFTPEQLKSQFTIRKLDKSMSSDTHIMYVAEKKDEINQGFLNMLKTAAVDCRINAPSMNLLSTGLQCYAFPINAVGDENAYNEDISKDRRPLLDTKRKIRGKVNQQANAVEFEGKLYDYNAYKYAGVLESAA